MKFGFVLAAIALIVGAAATNTPSFQKQTALNQPHVKAAVSVVPWYGTFINRFLKTRENIQGINTRVVNPEQTIMVKPAIRNPKKWAPARCNDGAPFAFQLATPQTPSSDWVIWLEGGGFCDDNATSCSGGRGRLSTTLEGNDGAKTTFGQTKGVFNRSSSENPTFYGVNMVYAHYCSSDAWSGATDRRRPTTGDPAQGWYFSGRINVRAMLETLATHYGLSDSHRQTRILFAGSSAGGVGVFVNADTLSELFPLSVAAGRVKLVADGGGVEPNFDNPNYRPGAATTSSREVFLRAYDFFGSRANKSCEDTLNAEGKNSKTCMFGKISYPFIVSAGMPLLMQSSSIDKFGLTLHGIDNPKDPADKAAREEFRTASLEGFTPFAWLFSGGNTSYHTILHGDGTKAFAMSPPGGPSFRDLLTSFWQNGTPQRVIFGNP